MAEKSRGPRWLGSVIDGGPGLAFLAVLLITRDFRLATMVLMIGAAVALAVMLAVERRFRALPTAVSVLAIGFGGGSLLLHDPQVLKMKTSLVDAALGTVLLGGVAIRRNPLKMVLGATLSLPDKAWATLAVRYGLYWFACALANELVRRTQSDHVWALFRLGSYVVGVLFAAAQIPLLMRHNALEERGPPVPPDPPA
ncbi:MAG TPA: septation protein IspZ [Caulobacteraceae bacterium]|jgi:intracellular septation protein